MIKMTPELRKQITEIRAAESALIAAGWTRSCSTLSSNPRQSGISLFLSTTKDQPRLNFLLNVFSVNLAPDLLDPRKCAAFIAEIHQGEFIQVVLR